MTIGEVTATKAWDGRDNVEIKAGSRVVISDIGAQLTDNGTQGWDILNIDMTDPTVKTNTVITITSENIDFTKMNTGLKINGQQQQSGQFGSGTSIIWNFPNAKTVNLGNQTFFGHVIAPNADVSVSAEYNGCIIAKSFSSGSEGHAYPYNNIEIFGASYPFKVYKNIASDNTITELSKPGESDVFSFSLYQFNNGSWGDSIQTISSADKSSNSNYDIYTFNQLENLEIGSYIYKIVEERSSTSGSGFAVNSTEKYILLTVTGDNTTSDGLKVTTLVYNSFDETDGTANGLTNLDVDQAIKFTNVPSEDDDYVLPSTGGLGTTNYIIYGSCFIAAAALVTILLRRRHQHA